MPYVEDFSGVYKIVNLATSKCYVGQSLRMKKRISEHFRLLKNGTHSNQKLQNAFNKYGEASFKWEIEALCEDPEDMDMVEEAFITGEASFDEPTFYNISDFAKAPMRGRLHTLESKQKIRDSKAKNPHKITEEYRKKLSDSQLKRVLSNSSYVAKVRYIVDNPNLSYAERGRAVGMDTSTVRKIALKYSNRKDLL